MRLPPALSLFFATIGLQAAIELPGVIGDHMVLQSGIPAALWGKSAPQKWVEAVFLDETGKSLARMRAQCDERGLFRGQLDHALPANVNGVLIFRDGQDEKRISDVLTGEVWLASGQSNMGYSIGAKEWPASVVEQAREEVKAYAPTLRFFNVPREGADTPQYISKGTWSVADAASVRFCSAVAWNFAVEIRARTGNPVGIVLSSIGGTPIEAWISKASLEKCKAWPAISARHESAMADYPKKREAFETQLTRWLAQYPTKKEQDKHAAQRPKEPYGPEDKGVPTRLYNAMIAPLRFLTFRGIIWYQGENNADRPGEYPELIQTLIRSWREYFGREVPFYYVELANYKAPQKDPVERPWTLIREAQASALELPKTGVACAIDVGQVENVHYWNKKPVGIRLADMALVNEYGMQSAFVETRSPQLRDYQIQGAKVILHFDHAGKGLRLRPGTATPEGFVIRDARGEWLWAGNVFLKGDTIEVSDPRVSTPAAVRYAWAQNPKISVENSEGLPLRPFRTDRESSN